MRRHHVAVGLVGIAVLLAACGSGGGDLPKLPGAQASGSSREMAAAGDASTSMIANVRYELADGVSTDTKEAKAYSFADTNEAAVSRLAKAFGVSGEVTREGENWTVGSQSSRGDSLYVARGGGVFSMSTNIASSGSSGCAVEPVAPDAPVASDEPKPDPQQCVPTPTTVPANAPSAESAKKTATDALRDAGVDVDGAKVTAESYDGTYQNVRFQHTVAGAVVEGYETYVGVGPDNEIISASGYLAGPESVGTYELATLARAVERLNESYSNVSTLEARDDVAVAPAEPDGPAIGAPDTTGGSPEPTVIKLTSVVVGLMLQSDYDGDLWLVPAYRFGMAEEGTIATPAADDKYIETPPATTMPKPVDGGSTEPGGSAPGASADCVAIEGDINGEVCASATTVRAGEAVTFRVTAVDDNRGFASGCFDGVDVAYGDDSGGDVRCEACSTDVPPGPGKLGVERSHTYEKPGTYDAVFSIRSGADCGQSDPADSTGKATLRITVA